MPGLTRGWPGRAMAALALAATALVPAAGPAAAADPVVLRVGTTQDLDASNPFNSMLVVGAEASQLTYSLLVGFDKDAHPAPDFADSWTRAADRVTFHVRTGLQWSDGASATSADVCFSWGLALAAITDGSYVGAGYLDPNIRDAGVTRIECPDASTVVAYTTDQSDRIYQVYVPILPQHIYGQDDYKTIANEKFDAPLVGTGPYTLAEWKTSQYARFVRNPHYWGQQGYEDEVVLQFYSNPDAMVQALKSGEIDYARDVNPDQFAQLRADPGFTTVVGKANGWNQLAFNTYGSGTGKTIEGGGPSTLALLDPAFRDALGYAVDKRVLLYRVLGGFGDPGSTIVPPVLSDWHVDPTTPRTFNIDLAKQKLDAAGYPLNGSGKRLDQQGRAISLRLVTTSSSSDYAKAAEFVKAWYGQLGIGVSVAVMDSSALGTLLLPSAGAKYDIELWGWSGNPDPNSLLQIFRCDAIDNTSDSQYCNPAYDQLDNLQLTQTGADRHETLAQMQNLIYNEAPYDILYYDSALHAYRTDRFAGWQNMPATGTPLFTYGTLQYTLLTNAADAPAPPAAPPTAEAYQP
ncbi:MAG: ABC transporter substrate-binding protein, partial [Chloroflexota bacterium]